MNGVEDIRDIQGPIPMPSLWDWIPWLILSALIIGGIVFAVWWWKKKKSKALQRSLDEIALDDLEKASRWIEHNAPREFSFAVSETIRIYIENRFRVYAARKTTEEFLRDFLYTQDDSLAQWKDLLEAFLQHCDLAKFGKHPLSREDMNKMLESAQAFVIRTTPQSEAEKKS